MSLRQSIIPILLFIQTFYCWWCFIIAKKLPYDENYGILIQAVLISMAAWVVIRIAKAGWLGELPIKPILFWVWIVTGSPLTYILALFFYRELFGSLAT